MACMALHLHQGSRLKSLRARAENSFCVTLLDGDPTLLSTRQTFIFGERAARERKYVSNEEGCFIIDMQMPRGWMCFDATRCFLSAGRLLNHAPRGEATPTSFKPFILSREWRPRFVATRPLSFDLGTRMCSWGD